MDGLYGFRHLVFLKLLGPILCRFGCRFCRVEVLNDAGGEIFLCFHWVRLAFHALDFGHLHIGQQFVVAPHHFVGNRHQLAIHFKWRLFDPDCIAVGFRHFLNTIETFKNRHGQHGLRLLPVASLQVASDQQIEFLVGAAKLDISFQHYGVVSLDKRVEQFVQCNWLLILKSVMELFALEHL